MNLTSLKIHNILSISDAEIAFGNKGLVLIDGWNHDADTANGAGKTAIFNALSFGLYGKMPRDVTTSKYLRDGERSGYVECVIDCDGVEWKVRRERPTRETFWRDGNQELISQEEFEKKIGRSYIQFLLTIYSPQLKEERFISLNDTRKKDFLMQLLDLGGIATAKQNVAAAIKSKKAEVTQHQISMSSLDSSLSTAKGFLVKDIKSLKQQIALRNTQQIDAEILELEAVKRPDLSRYSELEVGIKSKRRFYNDLRQQIGELRGEYSALNRSFKKEVTAKIFECPHCNGDISIVSNIVHKGSDIDQQNEQIRVENEKQKKILEDVASKINDLEGQLLQESELNKLQDKIRQKQTEESSAYTDAVGRLSELRLFKSKFDAETNKMQAVIDADASTRLKVSKLEEDLAAVKVKHDAAVGSLLLLEGVAQVFSPMGVQAYVVDLAVERLNERASHYMSMLWPNASYRLVPCKENDNGEIKAKFSEKITFDGRDGSLGSLSGGERQCVSLAVDLALVDVSCQLLGSDISCIIMDEPFDGMDARMRERAIEMLSRASSDRQIYIIDHASEIRSMFCNIIRIEKRDGISTLVESTNG